MKITKTHFILLLSAFALLVVGGKPAWAFTIDFDKIKPLTPVEYLSDEKFEKQTKLIEETPFEDTFLSYRLRLPKDWGDNLEVASKLATENDISARVLGPVAHHVSPAKKHRRSFFTLEALKLDYEIGARNWFINYIVSNGLSLEQVGVESKRQVEAIYVEVEGDQTYIVRVKVILNGARMVVARYHVPQEVYEEERIQQAQVIHSFELTNREEIGIEKLEIHGFLDQSFFDYPVSWTFNAPLVRSIDRMRAMLYHSTMIGKLDGQINVYLTNKLIGTTRAKEITYYRDKFKIEGYTLGKYIASPEMEYHKDMNFGVTEVYEMTPQAANMFDYELWVSVLEGEEYIYVISLLSPSRHEEFYTWARNVEAYKLILKGIRRNDESVDYYRFIQ